METNLDILIERTKKLLELDTILTDHEKTEHFDMRVWAQETECGTVACLAGHAAIQPWFKKRGFYLKYVGSARAPATGDASGAWACNQFFGSGAYGDMFNYVSFNESWDDVMVRVRTRLALLKAFKDSGHEEFYR